MRSRIRPIFSTTFVALLTASAGLALAADPSHGTSPSPDFAPGRIIVKMEESAPADAVAEVNEENDARTEERMEELDMAVVDLPSDLPVEEAVEVYEDAPGVAYAEPDYEVYPTAMPNDPSFPRMYGLHNTGQTVNNAAGTPDADIDAPEAWSSSTGSGVVVAVIDTGMDIGHPDLKNQIWTNPDEKPNNGVDDDGNGYVDDVNGWDFYHDDNTVFDSPTADRHATHVAGTIAAQGNNKVGVVGVAQRARIMPLKFIGPDRGYISGAVAALNYAVAEGVKISNNSYAYYDSCGGCYARSLRDAIAAADAEGHLFVTAAGNGGSDGVGDDADVKGMYPASYDNPNIVSVAATDSNDELTAFSNYGATTVDVAAPGLNVLSTIPGGSYGYGRGTSMASPHVAGTAALIKSRYPGLSDAGIKAKILSSVDLKTNLAGKVFSGGRLNAAKALTPASAPPRIVKARPSRSLKTRDRTPTLTAQAADDKSALGAGDVRLFVDGKRTNRFAFDEETGKIRHTTRRLPVGAHNVKVVVVDEDGLSGVRFWRFRIVR